MTTTQIPYGYPTHADLLAEFSRRRPETIKLLRTLPDAFIVNKSSYHRSGTNVFTYDTHDREHFNQIRAAIQTARTKVYSEQML